MSRLCARHIAVCAGWALCLLLLWSGGRSFAQQDAHYSQYMFNQLSINPAYAGSRQTIAADLFYRNQWTGFEGAPVTQAVSFHMPFARKRNGFGLNLVNDELGFTQQQWLTASYAFFIPVGSFRLSLGLRGGVLNYRMNWADVRAVDVVDEVFQQNPQNMLLPNVGTGMFFSNERFYFGFSVPHILNTAFGETNPAEELVARLYRHYFTTLGYVFGTKGNVQWKPSMLLKFVPGAPIQADLNLMALLKGRYWVGMSYRTSDALVFMMDLRVAKMLRLGYAYDYTLSPL
ncbi:MAG: type IX secretion system membrane protein PorP/SprF, partial [Bacteroidota bacterium]